MTHLLLLVRGDDGNRTGDQGWRIMTRLIFELDSLNGDRWDNEERNPRRI